MNLTLNKRRERERKERERERERERESDLEKRDLEVDIHDICTHFIDHLYSSEGIIQMATHTVLTPQELKTRDSNLKHTIHGF